jgi:hypothetical protein
MKSKGDGNECNVRGVFVMDVRISEAACNMMES